VDEQRWLACEDPEAMLEFLRDTVSDRKLQLFAVSCCRHIRPLLRDERSRHAVEVAERFADGTAAESALHSACAAALDAIPAAEEAFAPEDPRAAILEQAECSPWEAAVAAPRAAAQCAQPIRGVFYGVDVSWSCAEAAAWAALGVDAAAWDAAVSAEYRAQAVLLRDLCNPFHPVAINAAWLAWRGGAVRQLAEGAYQERELPSGYLDPHRLAVVADALEESGCTDAELLGHLRSPGPHVRGCWVLDGLTARGRSGSTWG
jgi:hypothetical protein